MPSKAKVPSLSSDGWIDNSVRCADILFAHFLTSDKSQSYFFNDVRSLPYILNENMDNINTIMKEVKSNLLNYFNNYFNNVAVTVVEIPNQLDLSRIEINIDIEYTDTTGAKLYLNKVLDITKGRLNNLKKLL